MIEYIKQFFAWLVSFIAGSKENPPKPPAVPSDKYPKFPGPTGIGDKSENATVIQKRLLDLGYHVSVDGDYGPETVLGVKDFQAANKIGTTGVVGAQTWAVLFSDSAKPKPSHGGSGHASRPKVDTDLISECPNFASRNGVDIDTLVLHNTEGSAGSAIARFQNASEQVSAHFILDRDGEAIQMVGEDKTAWHSGERSTNQRSIGIEIVAGGGQGTGMTQIQEDVLIAWCKYLMAAYDIPISKVIPHRHVVSTSCPGSIWPTDSAFNAWKKAKLS